MHLDAVTESHAAIAIAAMKPVTSVIDSLLFFILTLFQLTGEYYKHSNFYMQQVCENVQFSRDNYS